MQATADMAIKRVQEQAEKIRNDAGHRFTAAASPGDAFRQGDIYITLLERLPADAKPMPTPHLQLVPGATQGSRHCLDSLEGVSMFALAAPGPYDGPVLVITGTERTIAHPEHGDVALPGDGRCYGITYQRDLDEEDRERRVVD